MSKRIRNQYPLGQQGYGNKDMYQFAAQKGGFAFVPAIAAAYAGLKAVKPFSKANAVLHDNFSEHKDKLPYKIVDKISGIGKSLGFGQTTSIVGQPAVSNMQYQPIMTKDLAVYRKNHAENKKKAKQLGTDKKRKSKKSKKK